jgi:hypothetical protein
VIDPVRLDTWWSRNDPDDVVSPTFVVGSSTLGKLMDMMDKGAISLTNVKFDAGLGPLDIKYLYCKGLYVSEGTFLNIEQRLQTTGDIHLKSDIVVKGDILALTVITPTYTYPLCHPSDIEGEMIDCMGRIYASGNIRVNKNVTCNEMIAGGKIVVKGMLSSRTSVVSANSNCETVAIRARQFDVKGRFVVGNNGKVDIPFKFGLDLLSADVIIAEESVHKPAMRYVIQYGRRETNDPNGLGRVEVI